MLFLFLFSRTKSFPQFRYCAGRRPRGFTFYISFKRVHVYFSILLAAVVAAILVYRLPVIIYPFLFIKAEESRCYTTCGF